MSHQLVIEIARNAMMTALMMAGPLLFAALAVGLLVSVVQAVTQLQEQTLSFLPKLLAIAVVLVIAMPWMLQVIVRYTVELFRSIPALVS